MLKYKFLPHTSEVEFVAYGRSVEEAMEHAGEALLQVMLDIKKIKRSRAQIRKLVIRDSASSLDDLAWYFLQDLLSKVDEKALKAYAVKVSYSQGKKHRFVANVFYKHLAGDFSRLEIKAVTPYDLSFEQKNGVWRLRAVVDV